ncbi:hypothetical protein BRD02_05570 [Halobacteriales archaeon QS_8_69_73]|nr:MAG: hypothetical protein BRD02_05570 [Halobacteriales archaeon QS_8_69_73]
MLLRRSAPYDGTKWADYAPVAVGGLLVVAALPAVSVVGVVVGVGGRPAPRRAPTATSVSRPASVSVSRPRPSRPSDRRAAALRRRLLGLSVSGLEVRVEDARRRPTVAYELRANISGRARAVAPTAILGRCCDTIDTTRIGVEDTPLEPDRVGNAGACDGRSTVTDRGTRDGDRVSRELAGG